MIECLGCLAPVSISNHDQLCDACAAEMQAEHAKMDAALQEQAEQIERDYGRNWLGIVNEADFYLDDEDMF